jgi:hypothetical protein
MNDLVLRMINRRFPSITHLEIEKDKFDYAKQLIFRFLTDCRDLELVSSAGKFLTCTPPYFNFALMRYPNYSAISITSTTLQNESLAYEVGTKNLSNEEMSRLIAPKSFTHVILGGEVTSKSDVELFQIIMQHAFSTMKYFYMTPYSIAKEVMLDSFPAVTRLTHVHIETMSPVWPEILRRSPNLVQYVGVPSKDCFDVMAEHCPLLSNVSIQGYLSKVYSPVTQDEIVQKQKNVTVFRTRDVSLDVSVDLYLDELELEFGGFVKPSMKHLMNVKRLFIRLSGKEALMFAKKHSEVLEELSVDASFKTPEFKLIVKNFPNLRYGVLLTESKHQDVEMQ